jgi:DegV family protein with EDD domain
VPKVRIITDSAATFEEPQVVEDYNVTVVPLIIDIDGEALEDGIEVDAQVIIDRLRQGEAPPRISAPKVEVFEEVYAQLARTTDQILILTHSQQFTDTFANAHAARAGFLGRCDIVVIDSRTTSAGLGYLVEAAAEAAFAGHSLDQVVHTVRGVIPRIYSVFYVSRLDYLQRAGLLGETQALLGAMLDIKPILTVEDGRLITMEKARTHARAVDKMIEFVAEFTDIERLCILQNTLRATENTRMLQDRLALEFSRLHSPIMLFDPLLASRLGPEGMGLAILEGAAQDGGFA